MHLRPRTDPQDRWGADSAPLTFQVADGEPPTILTPAYDGTIYPLDAAVRLLIFACRTAAAVGCAVELQLCMSMQVLPSPPTPPLPNCPQLSAVAMPSCPMAAPLTHWWFGSCTGDGPTVTQAEPGECTLTVAVGHWLAAAQRSCIPAAQLHGHWERHVCTAVPIEQGPFALFYTRRTP